MCEQRVPDPLLIYVHKYHCGGIYLDMQYLELKLDPTQNSELLENVYTRFVAHT